VTLKPYFDEIRLTPNQDLLTFIGNGRFKGSSSACVTTEFPKCRSTRECFSPVR
jgi:hypothetical protein